MLKARINNTLIVGLSHESVRRLQEGKPIAFKADEFGLPELAKWNILIMYGTTEQAIHAELERAIRP